MLLLIALACGPQPLEPTGTLTEETFRSEWVDDDYVLRIRTPPGFEAGSDAPLVVQLDPTFVGLKQYDHTVGLVSQRAAAGDWPDAVVLGVDYPNPATRDRDYLPPEPPDAEFLGDGADLFFRALREEILPYVEGALELTPSRRVIVGHSNGGVFAAYAAMRFDIAEGALFDGVVSADFGVGTALFTYEGWLAERGDDLPLRWYASRAVYNGATQEITHEALFERLRSRGYPSLALQTEVLGTDHGGAVVPSFERGLDFVFAEVAP
jgi:hypothetical protein